MTTKTSLKKFYLDLFPSNRDQVHDGELDRQGGPPGVGQLRRDVRRLHHVLGRSRGRSRSGNKSENVLNNIHFDHTVMIKAFQVFNISINVTKIPKTIYFRKSIFFKEQTSVGALDLQPRHGNHLVSIISLILKLPNFRKETLGNVINV